MKLVQESGLNKVASGIAEIWCNKELSNEWSGENKMK